MGMCRVPHFMHICIIYDGLFSTLFIVSKPLYSICDGPSPHYSPPPTLFPSPHFTFAKIPPPFPLFVHKLLILKPFPFVIIATHSVGHIYLCTFVYISVTIIVQLIGSFISSCISCILCIMLYYAYVLRNPALAVLSPIPFYCIISSEVTYCILLYTYTVFMFRLRTWFLP